LRYLLHYFSNLGAIPPFRQACNSLRGIYASPATASICHLFLDRF